MGKNILVMPGTYWQLALVKRIKQLGHQVLLVHPYMDSPCLPYADQYLQSDIFDWDKVLQFAIDNHVDAVMSDECDIAMPMVSRLGEALGLCVQSSETVKYYTDKYLMKEFCKKHGLLCPEYQLCNTMQEAVDFFAYIQEPIIIKPLDSNASHGVYIIKCVEDIIEHFEETLSFSRVQKAVIAEKYIEGTEFTVDGIKTTDKHYILAISKKKHYKHNPCIANELFFSCEDDEYDYDKLRKINSQYVIQSGLQYGFTHAEYKYQDGEFYLLEIAARGGGNMISSVITQYLSGYDTYEYLINCALGHIENKDFSILDKHRSKCAVLKFLDTPDNGGVVKAIKGEEFLANHANILSYQLYFRVGERIEKCESDSARIGYYIGCAETRQALLELIEQVSQHLEIVV